MFGRSVKGFFGGAAETTPLESNALTSARVAAYRLTRNVGINVNSIFVYTKNYSPTEPNQQGQGENKQG